MNTPITTMARLRTICLAPALVLAALSLAPAAQAADIGPVQARIDHQENRIAQGIGAGTLTATQAAKLDSHDARIQAARNADLAAHDGHLTAAERANLDHRLNRNSARIFRDKHR